MAKINCEDIKKDLGNRLKTVRGHIGGIERMLDEGKDCTDILVQIAAIKSSIDKIGFSLIENNICAHITEENLSKEEAEIAVRKALKSVLKFTK